MAGRKPKPTALKIRAGNPGKRALNDAEPKPAVGVIRAPRGMLEGEGARLWRQLAPMLRDLGVYTEADRTALAVMCQHYELAQEAWRTLREDGLIQVNAKSGAMMRHPAAAIYRENAQAFLRAAVEFGLTPSSRSKLSVEQGSEDDLVAQLFATIEQEGTRE